MNRDRGTKLGYYTVAGFREGTPEQNRETLPVLSAARSRAITKSSKEDAACIRNHLMMSGSLKA